MPNLMEYHSVLEALYLTELISSQQDVVLPTQAYFPLPKSYASIRNQFAEYLEPSQ
jgi:hypothetical protein